MSDLTDGIASVTSLTSKINDLKNQAESVAGQTSTGKPKVDPQQILVDLQKNFNDMLNSIITSSDDETKESKNDVFSFYKDSIDAVNNLKNQLPATTDATNNLTGNMPQINPMAKLNNLDLDQLS